MENIPLINGRSYSFVDVIVKIAGVPTPSVFKIDYTEEQQNNYGTVRVLLVVEPEKTKGFNPVCR
jgi:hypothetical protein